MLLFIILAVLYFVFVAPMLKLRDEPAVLAEQVLSSEAVELEFDDLTWICDGYVQEIRNIDKDELDLFEQRLTSLGFSEDYAGEFYRTRSDDFDFDFVKITEDEASGLTEIKFTLWDTDGLTCVPTALAREVRLS